jgi:RNA polymerase-binding transcription factor DksA
MAALMETIGIDPATIEMLRGRLLADRRSITSVIESSKESMASFIAARRDVEVDDEHDPEGSTLAMQYSESSALLEHSRRHLDEVNAALGKMTNGRYGSCELCGVNIPLARLEARPFAAHCVRCAQVAA